MKFDQIDAVVLAGSRVGARYDASSSAAYAFVLLFMYCFFLYHCSLHAILFKRITFFIIVVCMRFYLRGSLAGCRKGILPAKIRRT